MVWSWLTGGVYTRLFRSLFAYPRYPPQISQRYTFAGIFQRPHLSAWTHAVSTFPLGALSLFFASSVMLTPWGIARCRRRVRRTALPRGKPWGIPPPRRGGEAVRRGYFGTFV
eukprot:9502971-Pyramimonas_sp.AAC.3